MDNLPSSIIHQSLIRQAEKKNWLSFRFEITLPSGFVRRIDYRLFDSHLDCYSMFLSLKVRLSGQFLPLLFGIDIPGDDRERDQI